MDYYNVEIPVILQTTTFVCLTTIAKYSMGIDAGFDMVPRLSKGVVDIHNWGRFIESIKERYKEDTQVEIKPNYIGFKAGEYPQLPF